MLRTRTRPNPSLPPSLLPLPLSRMVGVGRCPSRAARTVPPLSSVTSVFDRVGDQLIGDDPDWEKNLAGTRTSSSSVRIRISEEIVFRIPSTRRDRSRRRKTFAILMPVRVYWLKQYGKPALHSARGKGLTDAIEADSLGIVAQGGVLSCSL